MRRPADGVPPGCLSGAVLFAFLFLVPFFFAQVMLAALGRLGLSPAAAILALTGIFLGGAVNVPVTRMERPREASAPPGIRLFGLGRLGRRLERLEQPLFRRRVPTHTVIAVNVGGCVVPCALAAYEVARVAARGAGGVLALLAVTALAVAVCHRAARVEPEVGVVMPALLPPLVAAVPSLVLVPDFAPPVAFVAGVLGPLVGADLLHLREIGRLSTTGLASIGGAGTFDGIVLSGMVAALLA